jgi:hypothetical protein
MTRINVVPVEELTDQHLLAEWREMTRIPNKFLKKNKINLLGQPEEYTVRTDDNPDGGKGHVKFFYTRLDFLYKRYYSILKELEERGMPQKNKWPHVLNKSTKVERFFNSYVPTKKSLSLNRQRISERFPLKPRYAREKL